MHILPWILPPLLGAIIAFSTNWIAVVMLFRPHKEKRLFGWRIPFTPGLVPREKEKLGRKLGEAIEKNLLTPEVLVQALGDPERWPLPEGTIGELLEKYNINTTPENMGDWFRHAAGFVENLGERFPLLDEKLAELTRRAADQSIGALASMFVKKDKIYPSIKEWLVGYLTDETNHAALGEKFDGYILSAGVRETWERLPLRRVLPVLAEQVARHIPIADMVERKMATYDIAEAEKMILNVVGRELRIIVMLGGVFGFFIGLLSLIPMVAG
jgi:uncharacterized membrane protein YheB (UPF0754 family)